MILLLKRRYTPRASLGRLYLNQKELCLIREAPKSCYDPNNHCLEEGRYELEPNHSEAIGWFIGVGKKGRIVHKSHPQLPGLAELCPVTNFNSEGIPMFTKLAFLKLMDRLNLFWERGEVLELEIVSEDVPYRLESCLEQSYS